MPTTFLLYTKNIFHDRLPSGCYLHSREGGQGLNFDFRPRFSVLYTALNSFSIFSYRSTGNGVHCLIFIRVFQVSHSWSFKSGVNLLIVHKTR